MGVNDLNKNFIKQSVSALITHYNEDRAVFLMFLEGLCDSESPYYILKDLQTLAEVMKEKEAIYLIDEIEKYDYKAAQVLDQLVK